MLGRVQRGLCARKSGSMGLHEWNLRVFCRCGLGSARERWARQTEAEMWLCLHCARRQKAVRGGPSAHSGLAAADECRRRESVDRYRRVAQALTRTPLPPHVPSTRGAVAFESDQKNAETQRQTLNFEIGPFRCRPSPTAHLAARDFFLLSRHRPSRLATTVVSSSPLPTLHTT